MNGDEHQARMNGLAILNLLVGFLVIASMVVLIFVFFPRMSAIDRQLQINVQEIRANHVLLQDAHQILNKLNEELENLQQKGK